jgi:MFS family permease
MVWLPQSAFLLIITAVGLITGLVPSPIVQAAVESVDDPRLAGMATGVVFAGTNLGMLIGPVAFGAIVQGARSWSAAFVAAALFTDPALNSATNCDLISSNKYGEN